MWKRRAEIAALALLIAIAGGATKRAHIRVDAPRLDIADVTPVDRGAIAQVGMVALAMAAELID